MVLFTKESQVLFCPDPNHVMLLSSPGHFDSKHVHFEDNLCLLLFTSSYVTFMLVGHMVTFLINPFGRKCYNSLIFK